MAATLIGSNHNSKGVGGGGKFSSIKLLTLGSESTQEQSNSLSSKRNPTWYSGWRTGVLVSATSAVIVLLINIGFTIYAATNPRYVMEGRIGTLYSGSCSRTKTIELWAHLGINALSTLLP